MDEETLDIREYAQVLLTRWWILVLGPLVAVLAALGIFLATPTPVPEAPEYQATANVLMGGNTSMFLYPDLTTSRPVLEEAISDLALSMSVAELRSKLSVSEAAGRMLRIQATDADPATATRLADGVARSYIGYLDSVGELEYQATTNVLMGGSANWSQYPDLVTTSPVLGEAIKGLALSMSVEELQSKLSISQKGSRMVSIQATDPDPATAVRLADGVAQSYISYLDSLGEPRLAAAQEQFALSVAALDKRVPAEAAVEKAVAVLTSRSTPATIITPAEVLQEPSNLVSTDVLQEPDLASAPPSPWARNTALAAILGFILAVAMLFLLEYLQNPVRSPAQMVRRLGLSNLGSVPRGRKGRDGDGSTLGQLNSETGLFESVSQVAASLDFTVTASQHKTVAVTSLGPGDGRSSLVSCLGVVLSNHWRQVILVDSDFRQPSLHHHFNLDNSLGLSNLLSNPDLDLADVVQGTNYPRLRVVTAGTIPADPTNLIRCPRMSWLLERLKKSADLVLIDAPPLLNSADGMLLASQVERW